MKTRCMPSVSAIYMARSTRVHIAVSRPVCRVTRIIFLMIWSVSMNPVLCSLREWTSNPVIKRLSKAEEARPMTNTTSNLWNWVNTGTILIAIVVPMPQRNAALARKTMIPTSQKLDVKTRILQAKKSWTRVDTTPVMPGSKEKTQLALDKAYRSPKWIMRVSFKKTYSRMTSAVHKNKRVDTRSRIHAPSLLKEEKYKSTDVTSAPYKIVLRAKPTSKGPNEMPATVSGMLDTTNVCCSAPSSDEGAKRLGKFSYKL